MNPTIWAKPDQSYEELVIECTLMKVKETVIAKKNLIQRLCKEFGFNEERFLKSSLLTGILHDTVKNLPLISRK